jgi:hypothetical protein
MELKFLENLFLQFLPGLLYKSEDNSIRKKTSNKYLNRKIKKVFLPISPILYFYQGGKISAGWMGRKNERSERVKEKKKEGKKERKKERKKEWMV